MIMAFFNSERTPLYSTQWAPRTTGGYAGTCIFLILLATLYRSLFAAKNILEARWTDQAWNRRYVVVADRQPFSEEVKTDPDVKTAVLTANGVEETVRVIHRPIRSTPAWRFSVDLPRAAFATLIAGLGYLLMLAVMTFNVGYFISVLAGLFIGELAVGRFNSVMDEHH
ncbi:copper transporter [Tothia fuscella]|uniref:Copper transport protein n=1 Tax=Tothia fuscella TaxID=1048955 RepID=A0A9P4NEY7_9PEZI|nr:copper transporter [Tothia fuscella]